MQKNYYQILGVANAASAGTIEQAYRRAVDKISQSGIEDPDTLALLRDAYETLADEDSRASYDESLLNPPRPPRLDGQPAPAMAPPSFDVNMNSGAGYEPERGRRLSPLLILLIAAGVTVLLGWLMARSSRTPAPAAPAVAVQNTSTAPVSNEPLPADGGAPVIPRTADPRARGADQIFSDVSQSVVKVIVSNESGVPVGGGSGVVTGRGIVITNCHVVLRGPVVTVRTPKESFSANVALADETFDLCQLTVGDGFNAPAVEIGSMQYVRTGQKVFAIGAPQGLELTISEGIVSSLRETRLGNVIQTTAPISPGSSGGGLFNVSGQLIGITTFQHKTGQNLNFAVPADWIAKMEPRGGPGPVSTLSEGGAQTPQGTITR